MNTEQRLATFHETITDSFTCVSDPRTRQGRVLHTFDNLLFMAVTAVIAGSDCFSEIIDYVVDHEEWFQEVLDMPNGVPSYGTFWNVFGLIDPDEFALGFATWVSNIQLEKDGKYRAIDGKALRGTALPGDPHSHIHMVSIWACDAGLTLGQIQVDSKSNEITAIPQLLDLVDIEGCTITIDAMGTQKQIAEKIHHSGADYILSVKGNQCSLHEEVIQQFAEGEPKQWSGLAGSIYRSEEKSHGRLESRCLVTLPVPKGVAVFEDWSGLQSISMLISKRESKRNKTMEVRYFISSLPAENAREIAYGIRAHWGIENRCHWLLDVAFSEDRQKAKAVHVAANLSQIRRMAHNIVLNDTSTKSSLKRKRKRASWSRKYLEGLLSSFFS